MTTNRSLELLAKLQRPIDIDGIVSDEIQDAQHRGIPIKAIAADAGIALNRMYQLAEGRSQMWVGEALRFMRTIGSYRLLDELARRVGAVVVFLCPADNAGHRDIYEAFARAAAEMADVPRTLAHRLEDGELSIDDADAIAREIDEWVKAGLAMKDLVLRKAADAAGARR